METKDKKQTSLTRRHFLIAVGTGGAGAAAAVVGSPAADAVVAPITKAADGKGSGYAATEHVRNYYRTTRV